MSDAAGGGESAEGIIKKVKDFFKDHKKSVGVAAVAVILAAAGVTAEELHRKHKEGK